MHLSNPPSVSYKVYTALLTQAGTDAPVATVLQNTLGGTVVWTRVGPGTYAATLVGAFPSMKTFFAFSSLDGAANSGGDSPLGSSTGLFRESNNVVRLVVCDINNTAIDDKIDGWGVEIRVYSP